MGGSRTSTGPARLWTSPVKGRAVAFTDRITDGLGTLLYFEKDTASYGKNVEYRTRDIDDDGDGVFDRHVEDTQPLLVF